jgi:hypothetical protein
VATDPDAAPVEVYTWEYMGSLVAPDESLRIGGHLMTPEPVDALPADEDAELGMLLAVLQDAGTGLRWVMLYH